MRLDNWLSGIYRCPPFRHGYKLIRTVAYAEHKHSEGTQIKEEQIRDFRYLSDLFAYAKREDFFEDVAPYASDWKGYGWSHIYQDSTTNGDDDSNNEYDDGEAEIEINWENLAKNETVRYDDERFEDGGYEFSWDEPDDDSGPNDDYEDAEYRTL